MADLSLHKEVDYPGIIDYSFITLVVGRIADCNLLVVIVAAGTDLVVGIELIAIMELRTWVVQQASTASIKPVDSEVHYRVQLVRINHNQFQMLEVS